MKSCESGSIKVFLERIETACYEDLSGGKL